MSTKLKVNDRVTLVNQDYVKGVVTEVRLAKPIKGDKGGITVKWSNGNVVDISTLLAQEIVRKL
jgi:hypothetical protein